jgi:glucose/arabinose dehydrogenase
MPFCDLPGSLQFTESGTVLVPGGRRQPDLSFLHLPAGFCVHFYANVGNVRQLRFAPGGELFVASPSTLTTGGRGDLGLDAIVILPDDDMDGMADQTIPFITDLPSGQGMMFANDHFYYQNRTRILRVPYAPGDREPAGDSELVVDISIANGRYDSRLHWPKMLDIADDGRIFVTNGGDQGERCDPTHPFRGGIFEVDGTPGGKPIAKGFRNPIAVRCLRGFNRCYAIELSRDYTNAIGGPREARAGARRRRLGPSVLRHQDEAVSRHDAGAGLHRGRCSRGRVRRRHTPFDLDFETGKWPPPWNNRAYIPMHGRVRHLGRRPPGVDRLRPVTGEIIMGSELPAQDPGSFLDSPPAGTTARAAAHGRPANIAFAPDGRLFLGNDNTGDILWIAPMGM